MSGNDRTAPQKRGEAAAKNIRRVAMSGIIRVITQIEGGMPDVPVPKKKKVLTVRPKCLMATTSGDCRAPVHFCVYRKELGEYVFLPAGYGRTSFKKAKNGAKPQFCNKCRLQPCMNVEYSSEIYGYGQKLLLGLNGNMTEAEQDHANERIVEKVFVVTRNLMKELFGAPYVEKKGVPRCVWDMVLDAFPLNGECYYGTSDEEEEGLDTVVLVGDRETSDFPSPLVNPDFLNEDVYLLSK